MHKRNIFEDLERVAEIIPYPIYWTDTDVVILGANATILESVGGSRSSIIGKTPYEFYKPDAAKLIIENCKQVMATRCVLRHDESIEDITTGEVKYFTGIRGPIIDEHNNVIGIIGTSIDTTALKKAEALQRENELQKAKLNEHQKFITFIENIQREIQLYKTALINDKVGTKTNLSDDNTDIKLTARQYEILYFLSLNKSPKEIAGILSKIEGKSIASATVTSIICKALYQKLNVFNVSQLIEKAYRLNLIPFIPKSIDNSNHEIVE